MIGAAEVKSDPLALDGPAFLWILFGVLAACAIGLVVFLREPEIAAQQERSSAAATAIIADRAVIARGVEYASLRRKLIGDVQNVHLSSDQESVTSSLLASIDAIASRRHLFVKGIGSDGKAPVQTPGAQAPGASQAGISRLQNPSWSVIPELPVFESYSTSVTLASNRSEDLILALAEFSRLPMVAKVESPNITRTILRRGAPSPDGALLLTLRVTVVRLSSVNADLLDSAKPARALDVPQAPPIAPTAGAR